MPFDPVILPAGTSFLVSLHRCACASGSARLEGPASHLVPLSTQIDVFVSGSVMCLGGILVPHHQGSKPRATAVKELNPNRWTAEEVLGEVFNHGLMCL